VHACEGCHNKSLWSPKSGSPLTEEVICEIIEKLKLHDGLSLSGGDPLHPVNRQATLDLVQRVKSAYPEKTIWMWTGYVYSDVKDLEVMKHIDVLIDGKYEKDNPTKKLWRGSDNQVLIRLKQA
jgi:anaerobic ribonucleoside-triphosphate reductase activating protein